MSSSNKTTTKAPRTTGATKGKHSKATPPKGANAGRKPRRRDDPFAEINPTIDAYLLASYEAPSIALHNTIRALVASELATLYHRAAVASALGHHDKRDHLMARADKILDAFEVERAVERAMKRAAG